MQVFAVFIYGQFTFRKDNQKCRCRSICKRRGVSLSYNGTNTEVTDNYGRKLVISKNVDNVIESVRLEISGVEVPDTRYNYTYMIIMICV